MKKLMLVIALVAFFSAAALAADHSAGTLSVTASIESACSVQSASMNFGTYDPNIATATDVNGSLTVNCTTGTTLPKIKLGTGSGTFATRTMTGPVASTLNYNLYTAAERTTIWGDGLVANGTGTITVSSATSTTPIYGRIPASQTGAAVGAYTDTVTITLDY